LAIASLPYVKEQPHFPFLINSVFYSPFLLSTGSDHKTSQKRPYNGGSLNQSTFSISSRFFKAGEIPP